MKKIIILPVFLFILFLVSSVFAFGGCEENCQKCHSLSNEDVQNILTKLNAAEAKPVEI